MWQQWLEVWLAMLSIPVPDLMPSDQFSVSTEQGCEYVLENCTDHVVLSLRLPAQGYEAERMAKMLLTIADPQRTQPFCVRVGYDGVKYCILAIRLAFDEYFSEDLGPAFEQLWSIASELSEPS